MTNRIEEFIDVPADVKYLKFRGTDHVTIDASGTVRGAGAGERDHNMFVFTSGDGSSSGDGNVIVSNGSISIGGGSFVSSGMTMCDNKITWGSSESVKRTSYGLEIRLPESKQIDINGKRLRVSDIMRGNTTTPTDVKPEKVRVFRIAPRNVKVSRIVVESNVKLQAHRFAALSAASLDVVTNGNSKLTLAGSFAVQRLRASTNGNSTLCGADEIFAQEATLDSNGNSTLKDVNALGRLSANSNGNSSLHAAVADKNLADSDRSGNSKCSVSRMDDASILAATLALSALSGGGGGANSNPTPVKTETVKKEESVEAGEGKKRRLVEIVEDEKPAKKERKE